MEENQYEETLDQHEEMRNRIVEANFKWKQAQLMVDYAFKQLNESVGKWSSLTNIDQDKLEERSVFSLMSTNNSVYLPDTAWPALPGITWWLQLRISKEPRLSNVTLK